MSRFILVFTLILAGFVDLFVMLVLAIRALFDPVGAALAWTEHHQSWVTTITVRPGKRLIR